MGSINNSLKKLSCCGMVFLLFAAFYHFIFFKWITFLSFMGYNFNIIGVYLFIFYTTMLLFYLNFHLW
jgi:hypothetical protein